MWGVKSEVAGEKFEGLGERCRSVVWGVDVSCENEIWCVSFEVRGLKCWVVEGMPLSCLEATATIMAIGCWMLCCWTQCCKEMNERSELTESCPIIMNICCQQWTGNQYWSWKEMKHLCTRNFAPALIKIWRETCQVIRGHKYLHQGRWG